jgi:hypothetical protein
MLQVGMLLAQQWAELDQKVQFAMLACNRLSTVNPGVYMASLAART